MTIRLRRLEVFITVAEKRSVTETSRALYMTPPAVTKSLRELETFLHVELFRRTKSGMLLTPAGEVFRIHAERALHEIDRGKDELTNLMGGAAGKISIGATAEAAILVLPKALGLMIEERPHIDVNLIGGKGDLLAQAVSMGQLDFFLGVAPKKGLDPSLSKGVSGALIAEPLYADELRIVVGPHHPLATRQDLQLSDLTEFRWMASAAIGPLPAVLRRSFENAGLKFPSDLVIVEPLSSTRGLLQNTNLIGAVTSVRMREELKLGQVVELPVKLPDTRHVVSIIRRDEDYLTVWAKELISKLRKVTRELGLEL